MKVYISSTYQDLVDHRAAVDRTLRRMGHDVIGMEQYIAEGSKPVDRCKADVRAADAYVIIVAWRFGYVPGRTASPPDGRSITEIELAEAQASGKPVLAFLLDPEAPWPPNRVDAMGGAPGAGEDVSRLRALLGTEYLAGIFRTPDDLASQVAAAVSAQGLTRHMVDRVLGETSVASPDMEPFAQGIRSAIRPWKHQADDSSVPERHAHWCCRSTKASAGGRRGYSCWPACCGRSPQCGRWCFATRWTLCGHGKPRCHCRRARQRVPGARRVRAQAAPGPAVVRHRARDQPSDRGVE